MAKASWPSNLVLEPWTAFMPQAWPSTAAWPAAPLLKERQRGRPSAGGRPAPRVSLLMPMPTQAAGAAPGEEPARLLAAGGQRLEAGGGVAGVEAGGGLVLAQVEGDNGGGGRGRARHGKLLRGCVRSGTVI